MMVAQLLCKLWQAEQPPCPSDPSPPAAPSGHIPPATDVTHEPATSAATSAANLEPGPAAPTSATGPNHGPGGAASAAQQHCPGDTPPAHHSSTPALHPDTDRPFPVESQQACDGRPQTKQGSIQPPALDSATSANDGTKSLMVSPCHQTLDNASASSPNLSEPDRSANRALHHHPYKVAGLASSDADECREHEDTHTQRHQTASGAAHRGAESKPRFAVCITGDHSTPVAYGGPFP